MKWLHSFCWKYLHFDGSNLLKAAYYAWRHHRRQKVYNRNMSKGNPNMTYDIGMGPVKVWIEEDK